MTSLPFYYGWQGQPVLTPSSRLAATTLLFWFTLADACVYSGFLEFLSKKTTASCCQKVGWWERRPASRYERGPSPHRKSRLKTRWPNDTRQVTGLEQSTLVKIFSNKSATLHLLKILRNSAAQWPIGSIFLHKALADHGELQSPVSC